MKSANKISLITLGCSKNTVDSERLLNQFRVNDFRISDDPNDADTVIINTCGFIDAAKEESINTILNAVALKKEGKLKKVFVAGCLSARYKDELVKEISEVDKYFGTEDYNAILNELGGELKYNLLGEREITTPKHTAYLKISEGCDHPCSFCAIPLMRGKHVSKPLENLINETRFLVSQGTKELVIIAQDTTDYGKEIYGKQSISYLLNKLSEVEGIEWIRLMYAYPSQFPDDLIDVIANNPKVCKYIDIPLQHISDKVLKSMRRGVTTKRTKELVHKLKERIPGLALRTTFIVGYPNETEMEFNELCNFVEDTKFDRVGTFTFSAEENTSSFILGNPVPEEVKFERKEVLMEIQKNISLSKNESYMGKELEILIDGSEGDFYVGRSYRDAPEVDGEVLIQLNGSSNGSFRKLEAGNFCIAKVYDYNEYDLYAKEIHQGH
jgi:ribosomal protein S12 methylthiotransferase